MTGKAVVAGRAPDGRWLKGTRGGPGKKPMPAEVKAMLYETGEKAIKRLHEWVTDDKKYEATPQELKLRLLTTAVERAYGRAEIRRAGPEDAEGGSLSMQQAASLLDQVYDRLKAPELRYAMKANVAKDVTPEDAEVVAGE